MFEPIKPLPRTTLIIFGASGDLTRRKLIPALYNLQCKKRLPGPVDIIGYARRPYDDASFREHLRSGVQEFLPKAYNDATWSTFAQSIRYVRGNLDNTEDFRCLSDHLQTQESEPTNRLYYLAIAPEHEEAVIANLGLAGMSCRLQGLCNVVIEKPFGHDLASARALNRTVHEVFHENQIYRIDHYLGKETAQNILFFRFANTIFEPIWNRRYIDHVQITVAEAVDVGHRAGYYDSVGVGRDMFQNHLLQLYTLVAMEPPASFNADALRNEKVKVLSATRPIDPARTVRAQYEDYCRAEGVADNSQTPTYAAIEMHLDNWRWKGVPFYLRSGKAMKEKTSEIIIQFQCPPHMMFDLPDDYQLTPNILNLSIQPDEGIHLKFETKVPDSTEETRSVDMDFHYRESFAGTALPDAYERLLLDALRGDASLFARSDEIETAWSLIDPVIRAWETTGSPPPTRYARGSWGPEEADRLLADTGRQWRLGGGSMGEH